MLCWLLILHYIYALEARNGAVVQTPGRVLVADGETVRLQCIFDFVNFPCYAVVWTKIDPRTKMLSTAQNPETQSDSNVSSTCFFKIEKATVQDSGVYYCTGRAAQHNAMTYISKGSTVIVIREKRNKLPPVEILWPRSVQPQIPLLCVISGVVPSQVRVFWVVDGKEDVGLTESLWTKNSGGIVESTQNQILVSADEWERGVECTCVVEFAGKNTSKSVQNEGSKETRMLLYGTIAGAGLTFVVGIAIAVVLRFGYSVKSDGDAREQRRDTGLEKRQHRSGRKGRTSAKDQPPSDVTYATLQEAKLTRRM